MCDQDHRQVLSIDFVEERKGGLSLDSDEQPTVQHDFFVVNGEDDAGSADFASCTKWQYGYLVHIETNIEFKYVSMSFGVFESITIITCETLA